MKTHYAWVDRAKGIGMILVVMGHALADTMLNGKTNLISQVLFDVIYSFHMPLFFFLSGFCGAKALEMAEGKQKVQYISLRFKRLMIPYFFVGLLYVPLKVILSGEVNTKINLQTLPLDFVLGNNPNFQLWTLYALFISATMTCLLANIGYKVILGVALGLCILSMFISCPITIISQVMFQFFFYICGVVYRRRSAERQTTTYVMLTTLIIFIVANMIREVTGVEQVKIITGIAGILFVCESCKLMSLKENSMLDIIGKYSIDIYIMANLVQVLVRSVCVYKLQMPAIVCCIISTVLGSVLPIIVSKYLVRRVKIFKGFVLGEFSR